MDIKVKNAIISVADKTGLEEFARRLHKHGIHIYSTGGTAKALSNIGIPVTRISDYTGFPEILDGRVKSLHPKIHGGILAKKDDEDHLKQLKANGITSFDMVVINLYPFVKVIKKDNVTVELAIENIDIGGPSMLRSAAKNYRYVCVVPDPRFYERVLEELSQEGAVTLKTREKLALAVFEKTAYYDSLIGSYFHNEIVNKGVEGFPDTVNIYFKKKQELRYGENPHQAAAFYTNPGIRVRGVAQAGKLHGKELSFNNILDIESAFEIVKEFEEPACSIIKHTNPCGAAVAGTLKQAFVDALACDPVSAFGSIIGCNKIVDRNTAVEVAGTDFIECIIAPGYEEDALSVLTKKKNIRILETGKLNTTSELYDYDMKRIIGGILLQARDLDDISKADIKTVTKKTVSSDDLRSLLFAWKIAKHVKSNAIVLALETAAGGAKTVGIGAGQMSRVDATFIAISKAKERAMGSFLASDAFFPRQDAVKLAAAHGIRAIIQPGGSIRDEEVIRACNNEGIAMVFTGMRHFKH